VNRCCCDPCLPANQRQENCAWRCKAEFGAGRHVAMPIVHPNAHEVGCPPRQPRQGELLRTRPRWRRDGTGVNARLRAKLITLANQHQKLLDFLTIKLLSHRFR